MLAAPFLVVWGIVAIFFFIGLIIYTAKYLKKKKEEFKSKINKKVAKTKDNELVEKILELLEDFINTAKYRWWRRLPKLAFGLITFGVTLSIFLSVIRMVKEAVETQAIEQNVTSAYTSVFSNGVIRPGFFGIIGIGFLIITAFTVWRFMRVFNNDNF